MPPRRAILVVLCACAIALCLSGMSTLSSASSPATSAWTGVPSSQSHLPRSGVALPISGAGAGAADRGFSFADLAAAESLKDEIAAREKLVALLGAPVVLGNGNGRGGRRFQYGLCGGKGPTHKWMALRETCYNVSIATDSDVAGDGSDSGGGDGRRGSVGTVVLSASFPRSGSTWLYTLLEQVRPTFASCRTACLRYITSMV